MDNTLGKQLQIIRESRGVSLEEIAQKTHIRLEYLEAIEAGDSDRLPPGPQQHGFLRLYANTLGVEIDGSRLKGFMHGSDDQVLDSLEPGGQDALSGSDPQQPDGLPALSSAGLVSGTDLEEKITPQPQIKAEIPDGAQKISTHTPGIMPDSDAAQAAPSETPPSSASLVFLELGETLRQRRELLSLSMDDIFKQIHVQMKFLSAMEAGDFNQLPSHVQARGMLANYAGFLNLDVDEILLKYADGLQIQRLERTKQTKLAPTEAKQALSSTRLRLKNFFSLDLLVIAAFFFGFSAFVIWGVNRILNTNATPISPTDLPEVADILLATGSPTPREATLQETGFSPDQTGTPGVEDATPIFTPLPNNNPINIVVIPRQRVWVRIISDQVTVFEGRMLPGNAYDFSGEETLELLTGSAGALQIFFNEQDIGSPGLVGQVVNLIFTVDGLILPTPTNTPTITETPEVTPTPSPTATISETPEPSITPTQAND